MSSSVRVHYRESAVVYSSRRKPYTVGDFETEIDNRQQVVGRGRSNPDPELCLVCDSSLRVVDFYEFRGAMGPADSVGYHTDKHFHHCGLCGWWSLNTSEYQNWSSYPSFNGVETIWPLVTTFEVGSNRTAINILRQHLVKNYSDINQVSSQEAEDLVRAVFKDLYPNAEVEYFRGSVYTPDDGVDLVIVNADETRIGVQVKRRITRKTEPVEAVDRFVASLFKQGMLRGVYVSVAGCFSRFAQQVPTNRFLRQMGLELELVDARRFFDFLRTLTPLGPPPWLSAIGNFDRCSDMGYIEQLKEEWFGASGESAPPNSRRG